MKRATQGQSTVEYVVVVAVVIAALLATTVYMKRGKMGDLGRATDQVGAQFNPHQYSAILRTRYDTGREEKLNEGFAESGKVVSTITAAGEQQYRKGNEKLTQSRVGCEQLFFQDSDPDAPPPATDGPCPAPAATVPPPGDVTDAEFPGGGIP